MNSGVTILNPETYKHKHGIPQAIGNLIEPLYDDSSDEKLLKKCLHGKTQNNECLNKVIWNHCSKDVFVARKTVEEYNLMMEILPSFGD